MKVGIKNFIKPRFGLQTEIFFNLAVLVSVALLFSCLLWVRFAEIELISQRIQLAQEKTKLLLRGGASVPRSETGGERAVLNSVRAALQMFQSSGELSGWALYDGNLLKVADYNGLAMAPVSRAELGRRLLAGEVGAEADYPPFSGLFFFLPPFRNLGPLRITGPLPFRRGVAVIDFSLRDIPERIGSGLLGFLGYAVPASLIVIGSGIFLLRKNVVRPLKQLDASAGRVATGDLEHRVATDGPEEIFSLAESFNAMICSLRQKRAETERHVRELEAVNADLRETRQELIQAEKMASIGQLAAGLAHELGNPLGAVQGYLEILRAEAGDDAQQDIARRALLEIERVNRLVRDLLDYASPQPRQEIAEPFDPVVAVREAVGILSRQDTPAAIAIEERLPESLPALRLPRHQLVQVILNLLMNARDASTGMAPIVVAGGEGAGEVWLSVADRGEGIPKENLPRLFDPFFTTKATGKGRGLGLAICRGIVTAAGGRIEVSSECGRGTVFRVVFRQGEERADEI
ncbi:MAG: HAMP domain-containing protein [Deltaproteobacteria bacterium]|nr:HAMP domain-containing protein [Deltaproteobacteria bacterium]